jgi:hypothetical protein
MDGGEAFKLVEHASTIASDAVMGPLAGALQGTDQALRGLHNSGILNQQMFEGIELSAEDAFRKIVAEGGDGNAALLLYKPTLQTIWELQQDFGYAVDDTTQALLDAGIADGSLGEKHRSVAQQMLDATNKMTDAVVYLAEQFGYVADSASGAASKIADGFGRIQIPEVSIPYRLTATDQAAPIPMAAGGYGHANAPMTFSTRGNEDFAFSGEGKSFTGGAGREELLSVLRAVADVSERPMVITVELDGEVVARKNIKAMPSLIKQDGAAQEAWTSGMGLS